MIGVSFDPFVFFSLSSDIVLHYVILCCPSQSSYVVFNTLDYPTRPTPLQGFLGQSITALDVFLFVKRHTLKSDCAKETERFVVLKIMRAMYKVDN